MLSICSAEFFCWAYAHLKNGSKIPGNLDNYVFMYIIWKWETKQIVNHKMANMQLTYWTVGYVDLSVSTIIQSSWVYAEHDAHLRHGLRIPHLA